jgi:hypothetical protein
MYLDRLPEIQRELHDYQEKTKHLEIEWNPIRPVPTRQKSRLYDYFYTTARLEPLDELLNDELLVLFSKNPNHRVNFTDPHHYMLIHSPIGTVDDMLAIFHTHFEESDMGRIIELIRVIKGVVPEVPKVEEDANQFNISLNKEMRKLFLLAALDAQLRNIANTEFELAQLNDRIT